MVNAHNESDRDLHNSIVKYSDAVAMHGPDSPEAKGIREAHKNDVDFLGLAHAIDGMQNAIKKRAAKSAATKSEL